MKKKIRNAPGWLGLTDDRKEFVYLPDRAKIVQRIFQLSIAGIGGYTIAKLLNTEGMPGFGSSKKWDQSTIHNMLTSKATIGEYQRKEILEGKEVSVGEPIPNYYPAVIDEKTFEAAQATRRENLSTRRGRKGRRLTNLFAEIPRCSYCGSSVSLHNAPVKSLVCKRVRDGKGCFRFRWSYEDFEQSFLNFLHNNDEAGRIASTLEQARSHLSGADEPLIYRARLAIAHHIRSTVVNLTICFGGPAPNQEAMYGDIRRDCQDRYFTVELSDGTSHIGRPVIPVKTRSAWKFNSEELCEHLGLSPTQGRLTALLAEDETLASSAAQLGMTISTARWHLREIFRRTKCHSQDELTNLARGAPRDDNE